MCFDAVKHFARMRTGSESMLSAKPLESGEQNSQVRLDRNIQPMVVNIEKERQFEYDIAELYQVGAITQTHGLRGEVKVFPMTDDVSRFKGMKELILDAGKEQLVLEVTSARQQKDRVILKFKGIDNINDIEKYKGCGLYVTKEKRVPLQEDEYFIADLIGCAVFSDEEEHLGEISDVITTGANDVYIVKCPDKKEILIPAIRQCILKVDVDNRRVDVHLLEGLRS